MIQELNNLFATAPGLKINKATHFSRLFRVFVSQQQLIIMTSTMDYENENGTRYEGNHYKYLILLQNCRVDLDFFG